MSQNSDFPVSLIFPPQGHFTQPYLSLPSLSAYLKQKGVDVGVYDATFRKRGDFATELDKHRPPVVGIYVNMMGA